VGATCEAEAASETRPSAAWTMLQALQRAMGGGTEPGSAETSEHGIRFGLHRNHTTPCVMLSQPDRQMPAYRARRPRRGSSAGLATAQAEAERTSLEESSSAGTSSGMMRAIFTRRWPPSADELVGAQHAVPLRALQGPPSARATSPPEASGCLRSARHRLDSPHFRTPTSADYKELYGKERQAREAESAGRRDDALRARFLLTARSKGIVDPEAAFRRRGIPLCPQHRDWS